MDIYRFCMFLGFTGLASMALLGMSSASSASNHGHGLSHGHDAGAAHGGQGAHGHAGHSDFQGHHGHHSHDGADTQALAHHNGHDAGSIGRLILSPLLALLSPRVFFSVLLGFGATGVIGQKSIAEPWILLVALLGGIGFEMLAMRPVWNLMFRFASRSARTLESALCEEAQAVTKFDANGCGLISLDLDGQIVQVLGRLNEAARQNGMRVQAGDRLFVEHVDTQKNSCIVSPLQGGSSTV